MKTAYAQSKRAFEGHAEHEAKRVRLSEALANLQQAAAGVRKARIFLNRAGALQKKTAKLEALIHTMTGGSHSLIDMWLFFWLCLGASVMCWL